MIPLKADRWSIMLWSHYSREVRSGRPFYLAADEHLIRSLADSGDPTWARSVDPLRDFHEACSELLMRGVGKASVRPIAFHLVPTEEFSRVISLAVQQVLVVEQMLDDEQYSALSYFPRYRSCLGLSGRHARSNPMSSDDFQDIWDKLADELSIQPGFNDATITFAKGAGRDLNRNLPISQALFTTDDLRQIKGVATQVSTHEDEGAIRNLLYRARGYLGRRAHALITRSDSERLSSLCSQVQRFLLTDYYLAPLCPKGASTRKREDSSFVAFLESEDLFSEEIICVYLVTKDVQEAGDVVETALENRLQGEPAVALVARGEAFVEISPDEPLVDGDCVAVLLRRRQETEFLDELTRVCRGEPPSMHESNLSSTFSVIFCNCVDERVLCDVLSIECADKSGPRIVLKGGLLVDGRSHVYLSGYPPDEIVHQGFALPENSPILVNNTQLSVGDFLRDLRSQTEFSIYGIRLGEDETTFAVGVNQATRSEWSPLGYPLLGVELSALAVPLAKDQPALRGVVITEPGEPAELSLSCRVTREDVLSLIGRGRRLSVAEDTLRRVISEIQLLHGEPQLVDLATRQISATKSLPLRAITSGLLRRALQNSV